MQTQWLRHKNNVLLVLVVWHQSLPLMNSFNKTEAAFFVQAMLSEGFPFHQFKLPHGLNITIKIIRSPMTQIYLCVKSGTNVHLVIFARV